MKKEIVQILILLICCQTVYSQNTLEFNEIETIWISDSLKTINIDESVSKNITETEFLKFKSNQKISIWPNPKVKIDSTGLFIVQTNNSIYRLYHTQNYSSSYSYIGFVPEINSHLIGFCGGGTCQEYLLDNELDIKMELNSNYDSGLLDLNFSPNSKFMAILSSYDGPDFTNYYEYRAAIEINEIKKGKGIRHINPILNLTTKKLSITELVWIDENTIAIKGYTGERAENEINKEYEYLRIKLK